MFVVKVFNRFLEFYLSCSQRVYLHKLLQIEKSFWYRKLVTASTWSQKWLKLCSSWQLQNLVINFSERYWIYELFLLSVQNCLHKQRTYSVHILILKLGLTVNSLNGNWKLLLERCYNFSSSQLDELFAFLYNVRGNNVVVMFGGYFNFHSFNTITTNNSDPLLLNLFVVYSCLTRVLKTNKPFNLWFNIRLVRVKNHVVNTKWT